MEKVFTFSIMDKFMMEKYSKKINYLYIFTYIYIQWKNGKAHGRGKF